MSSNIIMYCEYNKANVFPCLWTSLVIIKGLTTHIILGRNLVAFGKNVGKLPTIY